MDQGRGPMQLAPSAALVHLLGPFHRGLLRPQRGEGHPAPRLHAHAQGPQQLKCKVTVQTRLGSSGSSGSARAFQPGGVQKQADWLQLFDPQATRDQDQAAGAEEVQYVALGRSFIHLTRKKFLVTSVLCEESVLNPQVQFSEVQLRKRHLEEFSFLILSG